MIFNSVSSMVQVAVVGVGAYATLVLLLRVSGKRTLSKMNAFDLVVTVALGSVLATILLSKDVALLDGVTAYVVLIGLQFVLSWLSVRSRAVRDLVKSEPRLLFYRGEFVDAALRQERVVRAEVLAAMRAQGQGSMESVEAVVLETDGSFSVLTTSSGDTPATLSGVRGVPGAK